MSVAIAQAKQARLRRIAWPMVGVGTLIAATAYIGAVDPNAPGHYPICPLKYVSGIDCPGCGGLRCVHSLAHGDIASAVDHNLLAVLMLPLFVIWGAVALRRRWTGETVQITIERVRRQRIWIIAIVSLTVVFTVARNLSFVPFLDSGVS